MPTSQLLAIGSLFASPVGLGEGLGLPADAGLTPVDLGPEHPSRSGALLVRVDVEQDVIRHARVQPGFNHRSVEKLFEVRDYRQALLLADRHDWQAPFSGELGMALACERLMGLVPPARATWLRMLLAEQARIASHLAHLSFVAFRLQDEELGRAVREHRESGRQLVLAISGNRVHPMLNRLGGLAQDLSAAQVARIADWAARAGAVAAGIAAVLAKSQLGRGIGRIIPTDVDALGLSGPVACGSGLSRDLRRDGEYLNYQDIAHHFPTVQAADGDSAARFAALVADITTSVTLVDDIAQQLGGIAGPVDTKLSKIVKLPDSEGYTAIQAPWGIAGFHVVSRATPTPWRLRLRTPSFANVQALETALVGCPVDSADVVMASLGWTTGDLDK